MVSTEIDIILQLIVCIVELIALIFILSGSMIGSDIEGFVVVYVCSWFIPDNFDPEAICKRIEHDTYLDFINCKYTLLYDKLTADVSSGVADILIWNMPDSINSVHSPSYGTISSQQNNDQFV
ncbi:9223_t:CDS:2 [Cetraspora pellucida]|uniref:9223_t:CDS:1 n=1 Tax=Cetraspora pellucida TaxID=1433469 RepID=A0A9N9ESF6_9GLOM|nr:9223_t:CDS:2 [Cetraspora pellucida]